MRHIHTTDLDELVDSTVWLQGDAEYLYRQARAYRDAGSDCAQVAAMIQRNAAHSAACMRDAMDRIARLERRQACLCGPVRGWECNAGCVIQRMNSLERYP
jgi:hypothetical protein